MPAIRPLSQLLKAEWHPSLNQEMDVDAISEGSSKYAWWIGLECKHEWNSRINSRALGGNGCPYCAGKKVLVGFNDLAYCYPKLAKEWHPTKNGELLPTQVTSYLTNKVWWLGACKHEWQAAISNRSKLKNGCPYCTGRFAIPGVNDLATLRPDIAKTWHPTKNGKLNPTKVKVNSHSKIWWLGECSHEWKTAVADRVIKGCPTCASRIILKGFNDFGSKHPILASEWHPTLNDCTPWELGAGSPKNVWWICSKGHSYQASIWKRVHKNQKCNQCVRFASHPEKQIQAWLESCGITVKASDRTVLKGKEIDIYLPELKVGIEFNGVYWHTEKNGKHRTYHFDKYAAAKAVGVTLLQVWEDDWKAHPELTIAWLAEKLSVVEELKDADFTVFGGKAFPVVAVDTGRLKVVDVTSDIAHQFFEENSFKQVAAGAISYGLKLPSKALCAVLNVLQRKDGSLFVDSFQMLRGAYSDSVASLSNVLLEQLLQHARKELQPSSMSVKLDNCIGDENLFASAGFVVVGQVEPDFSYMVKGQRVSKNDYTLERFKTDPALKFDDDLDELQLADINGLNRIWDAGKTSWVRMSC